MPATRRRLLTTACSVACTLGLLLPATSAHAVSPRPVAGPATTSATSSVTSSVTSESGDRAPGLAPYYTQAIAWEPCYDTMECGWLTVPLDYDDPAGRTIRLAMSRTPATGPADTRQGSILVNPGGPGGSGVTFAGYVAQVIAREVATQFDFIGFDPRGVGESAPITCLTGRHTTRWLGVDGTPDTPAEERRLMRVAATIGQGCLGRSPALARHVGTENTVRDMDIMREVLGDRALNWIGFSYGTYLGTLYAETFPDRVGRFVLDGALDPSLDAMGISQGQSEGFQTALRRFARDCATRPSCPFPAGTTKGALAGINRILASLDQNPLPADDGRLLTQSYGLTAVFYPMYSPVLWRDLRGALREAVRGNGTGMLEIADYANGRIGPDRYDSNMLSAFYAISCWDTGRVPGRVALRAAARQWSRDARVPELARAMSWGNAPCHDWYGRSSRAFEPASTTTTAPILVVGTAFDPATPYEWSVALSRQLPTSRLLTFLGDGHTAYGSGSRCIDSNIDAYLLTGALPAPGKVCR